MLVIVSNEAVISPRTNGIRKEPILDNGLCRLDSHYALAPTALKETNHGKSSGADSDALTLDCKSVGDKHLRTKTLDSVDGGRDVSQRRVDKSSVNVSHTDISKIRPSVLRVVHT